MFGIDFSMNFISLSMVSIDFLMCFIDFLMIFTIFFWFSFLFGICHRFSAFLERSQKRNNKKTEKQIRKKNAGARKGREDRKVRSVKRLVRSLRNEKLYAIVARNTFGNQNVENTPCLDNFWKLRCRKSACRCGAKHISKSKCTKHPMLGPFLEVETSKKCTPLRREAHFEVKSVKNSQVQTTFGS
jgi:hypothetical protein